MPNDHLDANDIRIKIQALADNELPESEIGSVLEQIQGSHEYRKEYTDILRIKRQLAGEPIPQLSEEWIDRTERRIVRRLSKASGNVLFIGSYLALLGYAIFSLFRDSEVPIVVSILVGAGVVGFAVLLGNAILDRIRESREDRYKDVIR